MPISPNFNQGVEGARPVNFRLLTGRTTKCCWEVFARLQRLTTHPQSCNRRKLAAAKTVLVLLLLTFCLLLLPLWESVIVLCFVVIYFMSQKLIVFCTCMFVYFISALFLACLLCFKVHVVPEKR